MQKFILLFILLITAITGYSQKHKRIVSLAASITQNLYLLGANEDIVGCTRFCITEPTDSIPVVADAVSVNMEKIVALQPDIVLASGLTPPKVLEGFERMGIKTKRLNQPKNFEEICQQFITLGEISGKADKAEATVKECKARLENLKKGINFNNPPKVFMEIGCDPLFSALPGSFMHDYIQQTGGVNIAQDLDNAMVSKEFVLLQNPDIIFVVGMGIVGENEITKWKEIKSLNAVKNNKIFPLDQYICSPTPVTFVETVEELIQLMKQEITPAPYTI